MTKIYIVTYGEYSDYSIEAVFLNKEHAEEYIKTCDRKWDQPEIEVYADGGAPTTWTTYYIEMNQKGDIIKIKQYINSPATNNESYPPYFNKQSNLCHMFRTNDKIAAIKSMNDIRAQIIALNKWGNQNIWEQLTKQTSE